ncbi:MAG: hypothetical protein LBB98_00195, partial [Treponema sp.]|nr:hypothetical protein [Treponema sp.]
VITQSLKDYTEGFGHIGETGSVNFRLEYVPFNLTGEEENPEKNPWTEYDLESVFDLRGNNVPVWIIRNRINDKAQDDNTDFTAFHNIGNPGTGPSGGEKPNGNGAVRYRIAPNISAEENGLKIENGKFLGPVDSETPDISFTTSGYKDTAEVYYAVVLHTDQSVPPDYSDYTLLGDPVEANEWQIPINLGDDQVGKDYDVYVIIYKDGEVSAPVVINTLRGGVEGDWIWGDEPCKSYYIASAGNNGNDNNAGTKVAPLATVQKALEKLAADYTSPKWPNKAGSDEVSGGIIILDTVKVSNEIPIDGSVGYPSIILSDDSVMSGGRLQAQSGIGKKNLLKLTNNARVTLEGGLILEGLGQGAAVKIRGVYVDSSTFTMNGGKISGNTTSSNDKGGGVYVGTDSIFTIEWRGNIRQFRRLRRRGIRRRRYVYHERRGNIRQFRHQRRRRGIPLHRIFHPHKDRRYHLRV